MSAFLEKMFLRKVCRTYAVVQLQEQLELASTRMAVSFMLC